METDRLVRKAGKTFTTWRPWLSIKPSANLAGLLALPCRIAEFSCVPPHNEEEKTVDPDELSTTNTKLLINYFDKWSYIYIYSIYVYIYIPSHSINRQFQDGLSHVNPLFLVCQSPRRSILHRLRRPCRSFNTGHAPKAASANAGCGRGGTVHNQVRG